MKKRIAGGSALSGKVKPINLREQFGHQYQIVHDEAYAVEKPQFRVDEEAWLEQIPCKYGHIYPHGGTTLGAWSDRPSRRRLLRELACCTVHVEGDHEINVLFDVKDFESVARILKPRRRRRLSDTQLRKCSQRLSVHRFGPKSTH